MALNRYDSGAGVRLTCQVTTAGAPVDPTTLTLVVRTPDDQDTTDSLAGADVVRDSLGIYHRDLVCAQAGLWEYTWTATGPQAAVQGRFAINPPMR